MPKTVRTAAAAAAFTFFASAAAAEDVIIFARDYTASNDIAFDPISVDELNWLTGVDCAGEWVEYHFEVSGFGTSEVRLVVSGLASVSYDLTVTLTADGSGSVQTVPVGFTGGGLSG